MIPVELKTPKGQTVTAYFDNEDAPRFIAGSWRAHAYKDKFYVRGRKENAQVLAHRKIMGCVKGDGKVVDHIDGNPLNNQKSNLRVCTHMQNNWNRTTSTSKTGFLGVTETREGLFMAKVRHKNKTHYCGVHLTPVQAAKAVNEKLVELRGEWATLNPISQSDLVDALRKRKATLLKELSTVEEDLNELLG